MKVLAQEPMSNVFYRCVQCAWIGSVAQMQTNFGASGGGGDAQQMGEEVYSNTVCPACGNKARGLDGYKAVGTVAQGLGQNR